MSEQQASHQASQQASQREEEQQPLLGDNFIQQQDFIPSSKQQSTFMTILNLMSLISTRRLTP
jgi:hypothetical protein